MKENEIGKEIVDSAVEIHRELGPGLLESVYETILLYELRERGLAVEKQVAVPVKYKGITFNEGFRADLIVSGKVIVELKSKEGMSKSDKKQILTYLKLTGLKLGYLLNFGAALMKEGIVRVVNGLEE